MMKKIQATLSDALVFGKRMTIAEQKIDAQKDQAEKKHDALKDYVNKTKDMLEARSDQMIAVEDQISSFSDELKKMK